MKLSELQNNGKGVIVKVRGRGAFRKRITEMGFIKGKTVTVIKDAPLKDPVEYNIMGYQVSLRRSEAELIDVVTPEEAREFVNSSYQGVITEEILKTTAGKKEKHINVALVGNPNCGKTTLFNFASGSKEHVGNYSGVTVDAKEAKLEQNGYMFHIVDLPGTYSLTAYSPEELYVRKHITEKTPDIVVNVIDASNLERNLYLTTQLIDMDIKVVIALNMYDELQKQGDTFDYMAMAKMIGVPIIPTVSSKGKGISDLFNKIIDVYEDREPIVRHIHINYGESIENAIKKIQSRIKIRKNYWLTDKISSRFLTIMLLEKDREAHRILSQCENFKKIRCEAKMQIEHLEKNMREDSETLITDAKYGFITGAIKETFREGILTRHKKTKIIDTFITHKLFGFPIFIFFMWIMFQATFSLGHYPEQWIEKLVSGIGGLIETYMADGMLKDLIINGIIDGVGGVIVFLPNILILFFFISLMEDTGYMARAAFIMDKLMHKIGLHGKSFIPLIMGFGCNVPAIMATRTIENRNDRLLTMMINPFMSCSARLPVYILIIGTFFPENSGTMLFLIYGIGILMAILVALLFKRLFFKQKEVPFVMELPPYRLPTLKSTIRHMWHKGREYLKKMGGVILFAAIIVWALGYFPRDIKFSENYEAQINNIQQEYDDVRKHLSGTDTIEIKNLKQEKNQKIRQINTEKERERQEKTYIGRLGKSIEPAIQPLGFDWRMGVSIISGVAAKEIVVSTMGVLYQADDTQAAANADLSERLKSVEYTKGKRKGQKVFTPLTAFVFMLFVLIYFPCVAVIAAIRREAGNWKWALFMVFYTTGLAWLVSFIVYQVGQLFV